MHSSQIGIHNKGLGHKWCHPNFPKIFAPLPTFSCHPYFVLKIQGLAKNHIKLYVIYVKSYPHEFEQSYIPHLKALMCGIKASEAQWRGSTLRVCQALLKSAVLLSEIAKRLTFIFGNCIYSMTLAKESIRTANKSSTPFAKYRNSCNISRP